MTCTGKHMICSLAAHCAAPQSRHFHLAVWHRTCIHASALTPHPSPNAHLLAHPLLHRFVVLLLHIRLALLLQHPHTWVSTHTNIMSAFQLVQNPAGTFQPHSDPFSNLKISACHNATDTLKLVFHRPGGRVTVHLSIPANSPCLYHVVQLTSAH